MFKVGNILLNQDIILEYLCSIIISLKVTILSILCWRANYQMRVKYGLISALLVIPSNIFVGKFIFCEFRKKSLSGESYIDVGFWEYSSSWVSSSSTSLSVVVSSWFSFSSGYMSLFDWFWMICIFWTGEQMGELDFWGKLIFRTISLPGL